MLLKKTTCTLITALLVAQPFHASAIDLGSAFSNLVSPGAVSSVNQPGRYQSGARYGFSAGGVDIRVPRASNSPALFTTSSPSIEIGCNGISAHFGGFSFISGQEFAQLLKSIGSGAALGYVSALTMKVLCPPCEAIVQEMKSAAQMAARLAKDSCQWGAELGRQAAAGMGKGTDSIGFCTNGTTSQNMATDVLASQEKLCKTLNEAASNVKKLFNSDSAKDTKSRAEVQQKVQCSTAVGNRTWAALSAFDTQGTVANPGGSDQSTGVSVGDEAYRRKLLLLNIMGAHFNIDGSTDTSGRAYGCQLGDGSFWPPKDHEKTKQGGFCPPPLDHRKAVALFMCGDPNTLPKENNRMSLSVQKSCGEFFKTEGYALGDAKVWVCKDGDDAAQQGEARQTCSNLVLADYSKVVKGDGFVARINKLLYHAVDKVRKNDPYRDDNEMDKQVIGLIQTAPFPLYQVINAAAIYPTAAADLLDSISILMAEQFAYAYFDEVLRMEGRSSGTVASCVSPENLSQIMGFLEKFRGLNWSRKAQIGQSLALQQALQEQIRQVNQAIQRQVLSADMLASNNFAKSLNSTVTGSAGQEKKN